MNLIESNISKFKCIELITLSDFYKVWDFDENSQLAILENGSEKPIYLGKALHTPLVLADRRILHFKYDENKSPIITLSKPQEKISEVELPLWRDWMYSKKLF